jgi:hypothetical protein
MPPPQIDTTAGGRSAPAQCILKIVENQTVALVSGSGDKSNMKWIHKNCKTNGDWWTAKPTDRMELSVHAIPDCSTHGHSWRVSYIEYTIAEGEAENVKAGKEAARNAVKDFISDLSLGIK